MSGRPVLGKRHATADRLVGLYAEHELATVRAETWYPRIASGFDTIAKTGKPLPAQLRAEIELAGEVLLCLRHQARYRAHWGVLQRRYWLREPVGLAAWRCALEAVAQVLDATLAVREPVNPL